MIKKYLDNEYASIINRIKCGENLLLLRYGDGEKSIMTGKSVIAQEGWTSPNRITELGEDLLDTLNFTDNRVIYGISCPCCDIDAYRWYISNIKSNNITFSNIFVNKNYQRFIKDFESIKRDAVVIGNIAGLNNRIGNLKVLKYFPVGDNCQEFWSTEGKKLCNRIINEFGNHENLLFVCSAGPMAEPILSSLYNNNPNNCYIDFGSSIDTYIHLKDTRPYTDPNSLYGSRNCWMLNNKLIYLYPSILYLILKNDIRKLYQKAKRKLLF